MKTSKKLFTKETKLRLITNLYPWQQSIINLMNEEPNDRSIHWIYDSVGNTGKSEFAKYLDAKELAFVVTNGCKKEVANLINIGLNKGHNFNSKTTFVFSYCRSAEKIHYDMINACKDGLICLPRQGILSMAFNCPHVICFSSALPDFSQMSIDRWNIYTINNNELIKESINKYI